jgi:hypothetical protein
MIKIRVHPCYLRHPCSKRLLREPPDCDTKPKTRYAFHRCGHLQIHITATFPFFILRFHYLFFGKYYIFAELLRLSIFG